MEWGASAGRAPHSQFPDSASPRWAAATRFVDALSSRIEAGDGRASVALHLLFPDQLILWFRLRLLDTHLKWLLSYAVF